MIPFILAFGATIVIVALILYHVFRNLVRNTAKDFFARYADGKGALEYLARERLLIVNAYVLGLALLARPFFSLQTPPDFLSNLFYSDTFSLFLMIVGIMALSCTLIIGFRVFSLRTSNLFSYYNSLAHLELATKEKEAVVKAGHFRAALRAYNTHLKNTFRLQVKGLERLSLSFRMGDSIYRDRILSEFLHSLRDKNEPEKFGLAALEVLTTELDKKDTFGRLESHTTFSDNSDFIKTVTLASAIIGTVLTVIQIFLIFSGIAPSG
jgi:hypothetical protein